MVIRRKTEGYRQAHGLNRSRPLAWYPLMFSAALLAGCGPANVDRSAQMPDVPAPSSLEMVDCLLPGQVRKLGSSLTYLTPRRPARATETECEIRGGEYVAYDRANYQTALAVWLEAARQGDPKAQNYVGEIYAKGMGTLPNYDLAAQWYQKAAAQGNEQAKINLGFLYEQGLGVQQDLVAALNLYRDATGVSDDSLQLTSEVDRLKKSDQELQQLKSQVSSQQEELSTLKSRLDSARKELVTLESTRSQPDKGQQVAVASAEIESKRQEVERMAAALRSRNAEYNDLKRSFDSAQDDLDKARERIYAAYQENRSLREQLEVTLRRLEDKESRLEELNALKKEVEHRLEASVESGETQDTISLLKTRLRESEQEIARLEAEKRELEEESGDLYEQYEPQLASAGPLTFRSLRASAEEPSSPAQKPIKKLGKFYALIIGNDNYANVDPLSTAVNDAKAMNELLRGKYGFETRLMINTTKSELITELWKLKQQLTDADNLVVYYAGHGEVNESHSKGYWLMTDAGESDPTTWISNNTLTEYISSLPVKRTLVIADSCYSGTLSSVALNGRSLDDVYEPERAQQLISSGAQLVLTSGGVSPVLDSSGGKHSVFAQALLEALEQRDGTLNGYDLFLDVKAKVLSRAGRLGVDQEPTYAPLAFAHKGGEFYFQSVN